MDWAEGQVNKLPEGVRTVGKYGFVTRDTALYQGMARAVQYGDFLGKAIYYDHMTKRKGVGKKEAMEQVSEEFVNFNMLPGRTRTYADSIGLTWFWTFKIRAMKIALKMMRDNPLRSLLLTVGVPNLPVMDIGFGSPIKDNMVTVIGDGRLGYSTFWGMMFSSFGLNPWVNLTR